MRGFRRAAALAAAAALLLPVSGCGENSVDGYCSRLEADRRTIADMVDSDSPSALLKNLPMLHDLADAAPEDVADEWQTFLGALDGVDDALDEAGVEPSDFRGGKLPAGLSGADRTAVTNAVKELGTADVVAAANGIEQQARDVCKVNFGL